MTDHHDLLATLAEIAPDSALAQARQQRHAATEHTQGSYLALFGNDATILPRALRFAVARQVAEWHQQPELAQHYARHAGDDPRLADATDFAERLTFRPVSATPQHLIALQQAGWSDDEIVTLAQLVAFIACQSRLLSGYRLIQAQAQPEQKTPAVAGHWHTQPHTHSGKPAPVVFTQASLGWEPWIAPKPLVDFSADQQAILARFGHTDSDYFRLLGRNLPVLEQRTLTDKGIFYTPGGLPRAERELAATVASKVNGCIYCASVHARKASQLAKQPDAVERLLAVSPGQPLEQAQSPCWQAEIAFAAALSATPAVANVAQINALREQGLDTLALLDLVQATAFFAWANRLMLTLGEPFTQENLL